MIIKELIQVIVCAIVDNPLDVSISVIEGGQTTVLELKVAKSDLGKVIGKQGEMQRPSVQSSVRYPLK